MKLSELVEGNTVFLEVVTKQKAFTFAVDVYSIIGNDLLLNVVRADDSDRYLSLGVGGMFPNALYNIIYIEKNTRIEWKGLNLTTIALKTGNYYKIEIKERNDVGSNADRRVDSRIATEGVFGTLILDNGTYPVSIKDVGINDIGFTYKEDLDLVGEKFDVNIKTTMNATEYELDLQCICRRIGKLKDLFVYGCELRTKNRPYAYFVNACRLSKIMEIKEAMSDKMTLQGERI